MSVSNRRTFLKRTGLAAGGLTLIGLNACAPASTTAPAAPAAPAVPAASAAPAAATLSPLAALEAKAKAEGTIMLYNIGAETAQVHADGFKKAYPWATVNTFVAPGAALASKVIAENDANVTVADVVLHPPAQRANYIARKAIGPTPGLPNQGLIPKEMVDPEFYSVANYQNPIILMYNSKLITTEPPKDIFEFANPSWKGKIAFEAPQALGLSASFLASHRKQWGDAKWLPWIRGIAANSILITANSTAAYQAVLSGERSICVDGVNDVLAQPAGAPVKALFYDGIAPLPVYLSRTTKSPHPNMAALFLNWSISDAGQQAMAASKRIPIRDIDVPTAISKVLPKGNASQLPVSELASLWEKPETYLPIFNELWPA